MTFVLVNVHLLLHISLALLLLYYCIYILDQKPLDRVCMVTRNHIYHVLCSACASCSFVDNRTIWFASVFVFLSQFRPQNFCDLNVDYVHHEFFLHSRNIRKLVPFLSWRGASRENSVLVDLFFLTFRSLITVTYPPKWTVGGNRNFMTTTRWVERWLIGWFKWSWEKCPVASWLSLSSPLFRS
jgi:hypothetical protein